LSARSPRARCPPDLGQQLDPPAQSDPRLAHRPPALRLALHAHLELVAEPCRALVRRTHDQETPAAPPTAPSASSTPTSAPGSNLERKPESLHLDQNRQPKPLINRNRLQPTQRITTPGRGRHCGAARALLPSPGGQHVLFGPAERGLGRWSEAGRWPQIGPNSKGAPPRHGSAVFAGDRSAAAPLQCRPISSGLERLSGGVLVSSRKPVNPGYRQANRSVRATGDPGVEPDVAVLETTVLPIHQSPTERSV
jgi:hypothetical protein